MRLCVLWADTYLDDQVDSYMLHFIGIIMSEAFNNKCILAIVEEWIVERTYLGITHFADVNTFFVTLVEVSLVC